MLTSNKQLLTQAVDIWGKQKVAKVLGYSHHSEIGKWLERIDGPRLNDSEHDLLMKLLPPVPNRKRKPSFTFIDLFAGIGGIRKGFEEIGGECVYRDIVKSGV